MVVMQGREYHECPKDSFTQIKRSLRLDDDLELQPKRSLKYGYYLFLMLIGILLTAAVYCKLTEVSLLENCWDFSTALRHFQNTVFSLVNAPIAWQGLKALCIGILVLLFTWGVMYFDSTTPGIEPPSPLSPQRVRADSGHTFHTGYILAVVNGLLCAVFFFLWS